MYEYQQYFVSYMWCNCFKTSSNWFRIFYGLRGVPFNWCIIMFPLFFLLFDSTKDLTTNMWERLKEKEGEWERERDDT